MSWDDDSYADEYGEHRPARATGPASGWQVVRRAVGYTGLVAGVVALATGALFAVNAAGMAAKPGGFAAPPAHGPRVELPPVIQSPEHMEQAGGPEASQGPAAVGPAAVVSGSAASEILQVDPEWTSRIAVATGIPERALSAYAFAHVSIAGGQSECGLDWTTIAAIGAIESGHGSHARSVLDESGYAQPVIIGPALDGDGVHKIEDTDGGVLDGDATWDRAVGPMQFIPSTWAKWAVDANGDDVADPNQIDDAAHAAALYLCDSGQMTSPEGWRAAVFSYNHDNDYVDMVATLANTYAAAAR